MTVNYDRPIFLAVEEFSYHYKCEHCGREWTEHNEQIHWEESLKPSKKAEAVRSRHIIALLSIGLIATASILGSAYAFNWFSNNSCQTPTSSSLQYVHFTIVMSPNGWNDSYNHTPSNGSQSPPWPIINVTIDSNVVIQVLNNDTSQYVHGFAIAHYFEQGLSLQLRASCNVIFFASTSGTFPVYDNVIKNVDTHGQLNVI